MSHYSTKKKIDILLKIIVAGSAISASLLAPKAVEMFMKNAEKFIDKDFNSSELEKLLKYMEKTKLVELRYSPDNDLIATATEKAKRRLNHIELDNIFIKEPREWDRKWRVLLYDIPATHRDKSARYYLVEQLHRLGFSMVQKSMWVYPYECSQEIREIADRLGLQRYMTLIVGDLESPIENRLVRLFRLHQKV